MPMLNACTSVLTWLKKMSSVLDVGEAFVTNISFAHYFLWELMDNWKSFQDHLYY